MYKVILVDDDVPMLEYVEQLMDWKRLNLVMAGATHSSELALRMFEATMPDLVITDIGLPIMDGIELARKFRDMKPDVRIIFLTCYADFHYTKMAFQLEADDYLIKDELTSEKLADAVKKSLRWLKGKEESLERLAFRQDLERNRDVLKQTFFDQMLKTPDLRDALMFGQRLGIRWEHEHFALAQMYIHRGSLSEQYSLKHVPLLQYAVYNIAEEMAGNTSGITPILYKDKGINVVFNISRQPGKGSIAGKIAGYLHAVADKVKEFLKIDLLSYYTDELAGRTGLGALYRKLTAGLDTVYYGERNPFQVNHISANFVHPDTGEFDKAKSMALQAFSDENPLLIDIALGSIKTSARQKRVLPAAATGAFGDVVRAASARTHISVSQQFYGFLQQSLHIDEAERLARSELKSLLKQAVLTVGEPQQDADLRSIDRYIQDHICEMVTSIDVANYLHMNSSYFSRFFKKRSGVNFTDYVHQYKMKLAKRLLQSPDETVENVAYSLGYSDRAYFSKVFKKYVGLSPSDYKYSYAPS
jgi:two-component system response regulator YesN